MAFVYIILAPVVQTVDRAIHRIKIYPVDNAIDLRTTHRLDSELSRRLRNPTFEQLGPGEDASPAKHTPLRGARGHDCFHRVTLKWIKTDYFFCRSSRHSWLIK